MGAGCGGLPSRGLALLLVVVVWQVAGRRRHRPAPLGARVPAGRGLLRQQRGSGVLPGVLALAAQLAAALQGLKKGAETFQVNAQEAAVQAGQGLRQAAAIQAQGGGRARQAGLAGHARQALRRRQRGRLRRRGRGEWARRRGRRFHAGNGCAVQCRVERRG